MKRLAVVTTKRGFQPSHTGRMPAGSYAVKYWAGSINVSCALSEDQRYPTRMLGSTVPSRD